METSPVLVPAAKEEHLLRRPWSLRTGKRAEDNLGAPATWVRRLTPSWFDSILPASSCTATSTSMWLPLIPWVSDRPTRPPFPLCNAAKMERTLPACLNGVPQQANTVQAYLSLDSPPKSPTYSSSVILRTASSVVGRWPLHCAIVQACRLDAERGLRAFMFGMSWLPLGSRQPGV